MQSVVHQHIMPATQHKAEI